ncbi:MAG: Veg family protein [Coriobacteriales bacterium]
MDEDIIEPVQTVTSIHETLTGYTGKRLRIRANMGRSKIVEREGILTQVHPSLFIVETLEKRGRKARQSYQYVDVLTGMVELTDLETNELLFPEIREEVLQ